MSEQLPSTNQNPESQADADLAAYTEELRDTEERRKFQESLYGDAPLGKHSGDKKRIDEAITYAKHLEAMPQRDTAYDPLFDGIADDVKNQQKRLSQETSVGVDKLHQQALAENVQFDAMRQAQLNEINNAFASSPKLRQMDLLSQQVDQIEQGASHETSRDQERVDNLKQRLVTMLKEYRQTDDYNETIDHLLLDRSLDPRLGQSESDATEDSQTQEAKPKKKRRRQRRPVRAHRKNAPQASQMPSNVDITASEQNNGPDSSTIADKTPVSPARPKLTPSTVRQTILDLTPQQSAALYDRTIPNTPPSPESESSPGDTSRPKPSAEDGRDKSEPSQTTEAQTATRDTREEQRQNIMRYYGLDGPREQAWLDRQQKIDEREAKQTRRKKFGEWMTGHFIEDRRQEKEQRREQKEHVKRRTKKIGKWLMNLESVRYLREINKVNKELYKKRKEGHITLKPVSPKPEQDAKDKSQG